MDLRDMKRWLLLLYFPFSSYAQCDLELLDFDPIFGTVTVAFNSTDGCGGEGAPDGISELQFGFQALDEDCNAMNIGWDFPSGFSLTPRATTRVGYIPPLLRSRQRIGPTCTTNRLCRLTMLAIRLRSPYSIHTKLIVSTGLHRDRCIATSRASLRTGLQRGIASKLSSGRLAMGKLCMRLTEVGPR